jgi:O-antigen ligase/Flp pilus assembly protein TadD
MSSKSTNYLVYAVKAGLYILPVLSLIVASSFFFPFITGKNFFFRIMVEILFFLWIFVACFDKSYRPKKSSILIAISATLFFLTLATIFGVNPYRSFWSNFERMEGLIGHIHLFLYFLVLTSVFKKEKDWKLFFIDLIGVSFILVVYGFLQFLGLLEVHQGGTRLDATLGNATYYAIFLIFHLFLIGLLFLRTKNRWLRSGLALLFVFELILVFMTATRGAILGVIGGAIIFAVLAAIFTSNRKIRYGAAGFLVFLALLITLFLLVRHSEFIQKDYVFSRLANISFQETTTESRLTIWQMAFKGFLEHPLLGWGPENFNQVFNKYYEPELWPQEPWFDRSHDIVFDWLISAGILGFLAYWSIWGAAVYTIIKLYRKRQFIWQEMALFFALFAAYAFHNLFVFDNLTSYFLFFSILGYLHFRNTELQTRQESPEEPPKFHKNQNIGLFSYILITLAFVAVVLSLYFLNLKPVLACRQLLVTLSEIKTNGTDIDFILKEFDKVFSYNSFANGEAREQLAGYAQQVVSTSGITQEEKTKAVSRAIEEMEKQVAESPADARSLIFLTLLHTKAGRFEDALGAANRALELSPKKQQIYFAIADIYLSSQQYEKAFETLQQAYDLDRSYPEAGKNLAIVAVLADKVNLAEKIMGIPEKEWPVLFGNEKQFINVYAKMGDYGKVKELWQMLIAEEPDNAQLHVSLAATYLQLGERQNAIKELEKAIELEPQFKEQGEYYINEIKAGRNP